MIDTHTHIYLKDFAEDRQEMLNRAREAGVERFYLPNIDISSLPDLKHLAETEKDCYPMTGLHPGSVKTDYKEQLAALFADLEKHPHYYKAIGEIGMDLYWDKTFVEEQKKAFAIQIEKAKELGLPIVIHCREAFDETFEILDMYADEKLFGIFHCFTGNVLQAQRAIHLNMKLGIGGVVTFKNGGLDKVVEQIDPEHFVLETDAPYLTPAPYRGKRNEPSYLPLIAQKIADLHEMPLEKLIAISTQNALRIFGE